MLTLKETAVEVSPFVGASGSCEDDPIVNEAINRARRLLYELGDWKGTTSDMVIQSYGGTITLPPAYSHIKTAWTTTRHMTLPNEWYAIITQGWKETCKRMFNPVRVNEPTVTFRDFTMTYKADCFFRVGLMFESEKESTDTELVVHGYNKQGGRAELKRRFSKPFSTGTETPVYDVYMRNLYYMEKPKTDGRVRIIGFHPDTEKEMVMGIFEQDDINPSLSRYMVGGNSALQYALTAKKKYRPLVNESDPVDIHVDALIHAIQALNFRRASKFNEFNASMAMATQILNRELGQGQVLEQGYIRTAHGGNSNLNDY